MSLLTTLLDILGALFIVCAAFLLSPILGVFVLGATFLVASWQLTRSSK